MTKYYKNPPIPENYTRPEPPPCPPPPPSRVFKCMIFGLYETKESKQATQDWLDNNNMTKQQKRVNQDEQ